MGWAAGEASKGSKGGSCQEWEKAKNTLGLFTLFSRDQTKQASVRPLKLKDAS